MADLVIKISGDIKAYKDALTNAQKSTEDLEGALASVAKISAVAFAGLTASIGLTVKAYAESEAATNKLTQALQTQGIYSDELVKSYKDQAAELQNLTGIDDDAIISAMALGQTYLGNVTITKELTQAVLDFATAQGIDLDSAFQLVGKAANGGRNAFAAYGVELSKTGSVSENLERITKGLTSSVGGQAEAANKGLGSIKGLKESFGDFIEEIGSRFAPFVIAATQHLTSLFQSISKNKPLLDFIFIVGTAATAITGIIAGVASIGAAFVALGPIIVAANVALATLGVTVAGLAAASGIGLLVIAVGALGYALTRTSEKMDLKGKSAKELQEQLEGLKAKEAELANAPTGLFYNGEREAMKQANLKKVRDEMKQVEEAQKALDSAGGGAGGQDPALAKAAAERQKLQQEQHNREIASAQAKNQILILEASGASDKEIEIQKEKNEILAALADENFQGDKEALTTRLQDINNIQSEFFDASEEEIIARSEAKREMELEQFALDQEQKSALNDEILDNDAEFQEMTAQQQEIFRLQNQEKMSQQILTEKTARDAAITERAKAQIESNNRYLMDQQKYGTAYAEINRIIHSNEVQGTKNATAELTQLTQSKNEKLKAIGKLAAVASVVIKTAESAMSIYAGFSTIPIIGPALGIAGAAAAVAFGGEQIGKINGAALGGLLTGGIPGVDSIPVMAQQGELVAPTQNFEEVIGSVRAAREAEKVQDTGGAFGGGSANIAIGFDGREASQVLTVRQIEDRALGISRDSNE